MRTGISITVSSADRQRLQAVVKDRNAAQKHAWRAEIVLLSADGLGTNEIACILAERRGIKIVAPVHDAIMAEGPIDEIKDVSLALDRVMRDASAIVLRGYELSTEEKIIRPGEHYHDKRGAAMWQTVTELVAKAEMAA